MTCNGCYSCRNWEQDDSSLPWGWCTHPDFDHRQVLRGAFSERGLPVPIPQEVLDDGLTGYLDTCPGFDGWPGWVYLPTGIWMFARRNGLDLATLAAHLDPFNDNPARQAKTTIPSPLVNKPSDSLGYGYLPPELTD